jgi:hypothetical protein
MVPALVSDELGGDDFKLFMSGFEELDMSEDEIDEPANYREIKQFLVKEGWMKHIDGFSPSEILLLTSPPKKDDVLLKPVARNVDSLMSNIQVTIGMAGYQVRRLLGRRPS